MNKTSLFLASLLSLGLFGCATPSEAPPAAEPTPEVEAEVEPTSEEIAAHGIAALTDALTRVDWQTLSDKADEEADNKALEVSLGRLVDEPTVTVDGILDLLAFEITLSIDLADYAIADGETVSGHVEISLKYKATLFKKEIIVIANTANDDPIVFSGGNLDGDVLGLEDLKLTFGVTNIQKGIPTDVKGVVRVNGFGIPIDSKIIELILSLI